LVLCTVLFLTFLDNTIVSVTLANMQTDLHAGVTTLQWIVNGYALTFAAFMLAGGTLGDLLGRKRVMLAGVVVFCAGSVLGAFAPNSGTLIAARIVMGLGAAASEPGTLSIIRQVYRDPGERARALGVWAGVSGAALAMGPVIAGVLVGISDWRAVFWFNLVFGMLTLIAGVLVLPESSDPQPGGIDVPGVILGAASLGAVIFGVMSGEVHGYATWWVIGLFVVGAIGLVAFVVTELRSPAPLVELRFFRNRSFLGSNIVAFGIYFGVFSIFFFVALYLQLIAGRSPCSTALDFVPMTILMIIAAVLTGRWVARAGPRTPMVVGCAIAGAGILLVDAVLGPHVTFLDMSWTLAIAGVGFGMALVPVTTAALGSIPAEHSGMAAATKNASRELGAVFGVAVLCSLVNGQLNSDLKRELHALHIPANIQSVVIHVVTHGGNTAGVGGGSGGIVAKITQAAEHAFYSGIHIAMLLSGLLLLACAVAAAVLLRPEPSGNGATRAATGSTGRPDHHQRAMSRHEPINRSPRCAQREPLGFGV
jgi:EmrB/QacA subfamily drug resistance transporter